MASEPSNPIRLAYADDHAAVRKGIMRILTDAAPEFHFVVEAPNGKVLLEEVEKLDDLPDAFLLDVSMPTMNGYDTLVALKKRYGDKANVLMITMHDHEGIIVPTIRAGANGFLLKMSEPEEIVQAVRQVAKGEFYNSDLVTETLLASLRADKTHQNGLSEREKQFLKLCTTDMTTRQIAIAMEVSPRTVEGLSAELCKRLGAKSRIGLVMYAVQTGLTATKSKRPADY